MKLPGIGKMPEIRAVIENLQIRPLFGNVVRIAVVLVQNDVENQLVIDLFLNGFPLLAVLVFFLNGFQRAGRGVGPASGLHIEGARIVIEEQFL